jgi:hypothetical protein
MQSQSKKELKISSAGFLANAIVQFAAFFVYTQYEIFWPYYIVIGMLSFLILIQTIAAAAVFAGYSSSEINSKNTNNAMRFSISLVYMVSCYQLYIIGYTIFSVIAFTHVAILLLTSILSSIKS